MAAKSKAEVRQLQGAINSFTKRQRLGYAPLIVDGELGKATRKRIREVKFDLGYVRKQIKVKSGAAFIWRLNHPTRVSGEYHQTKQAVRRGRRRRISRRRRLAGNQVRSYVTSGVTRYDGVPVAAWLVPYLDYARSHGWRGRLNSGWRDPNYSQSLCYRMCGAPSCPGRCAGLSSNHVGSVKPKGALDVSDYGTFGRLMATCPLQPQLRNVLGARDPVHYSVSGN